MLAKSFASPLKPLPFYILLVLNAGEAYGHEIARLIYNFSQQKYMPKTGVLYPMLKRLVADGLAETGKVNDRQYYCITPLGTILVKEELRRMRHAVNIGKRQGVFNDELPLDVQRFLANLQ